MTKDEKIAFTEKYRTQYEAAYARHGSALKTPKPAHFSTSIKDKNVFLGGALPVPPPLEMPTVYSKDDASKSAEVADAVSQEFFTTLVLGYRAQRDHILIEAWGYCRQINKLTDDNSAMGATNERLHDETTSLRVELADYKSAIRGGITHPPLSGDCHMIWWPDNQPVPSFGESGETYQVIELREAITALTAERDAVCADLFAARQDVLGWGQKVIALEVELKAFKKHHDRWIAQYGPTISSLHDENMRLHDQLAKFTAANVPEPEPAKPNPFRDFPNDPRRMGR